MAMDALRLNYKTKKNSDTFDFDIYWTKTFKDGELTGNGRIRTQFLQKFKKKKESRIHKKKEISENRPHLRKVQEFASRKNTNHGKPHYVQKCD